MKITAEFNSNEELLNFISTFGANTIQKIESKEKGQASAETTEKKEATKETPKKEAKESTKKEEKSNQIKNEQVEPDKSTEVTKEAEQTITREATQVEVTKEATQVEITKEMVRAAFTKLIQAGKQADAKAITQKYGANKLPELKEEHYASAIKEVEELL